MKGFIFPLLIARAFYPSIHHTNTSSSSPGLNYIEFVAPLQPTNCFNGSQLAPNRQQQNGGLTRAITRQQKCLKLHIFTPQD